jgi:NADH:ubiquinone oxidoreductase subunit D
MENIISHFKYWSFGFNLKKSIISTQIESPKGEFCISLFTDNTEIPYRCKIRSPSLHSLQFIKFLSKNIFLSDLVTLVGTIDIVFGEIDR